MKLQKINAKSDATSERIWAFCVLREAPSATTVYARTAGLAGRLLSSTWLLTELFLKGVKTKLVFDIYIYLLHNLFQLHNSYSCI